MENEPPTAKAGYGPVVYNNILATHPSSVQEQNVASSGYVRWIIVMFVPSAGVDFPLNVPARCPGGTIK